MNQVPSREYGLSPVIGKDPWVLILGSFPSKMSLAANLYYANPRNHFWRITQILLSLETSRATTENQEALTEHHIALWDVIASREFQVGAGDRDIKNPVYQDIPTFLRSYPTLRCVALNGGKAGECFRKITRSAPVPDKIVVQQLPSTSPANATSTFDQKLERWRTLLGFLVP